MMCLEIADKISTFVVLKRCLLQQRRTEAICVFIICGSIRQAQTSRPKCSAWANIVKLRHRAKLRGDPSNHCWNMAI